MDATPGAVTLGEGTASWPMTMCYAKEERKGLESF